MCICMRSFLSSEERGEDFVMRAERPWVILGVPGDDAKPIINNDGNSASGSIGQSEVPPAQSECSPKRQIRPVTKISTVLMAKCNHRRMI